MPVGDQSKEAKEPEVKPVEVVVKLSNLPELKVLAAPVPIFNKVPEVTPVEPM